MDRDHFSLHELHIKMDSRSIWEASINLFRCYIFKSRIIYIIELVSMGGAWLRNASCMYFPMFPSAIRWKKKRCSNPFSDMDRNAGSRSRRDANLPSSELCTRLQYSSRHENICNVERIYL